MTKILTVTLNPALDVSSAADRVTPGPKIRLDPPLAEPGGGGINVARAAAKLGDYGIVDARAAERFRGEVAEPRAGLRSGHIPGAKNVPYTALLNDDKTMKDPAGIRGVFEGAGVDLKKPVIASCGSGVTACVLALALERIGKTDHAVYDGSWTEWGAFPTLPVATGE